MLELRSAPFRHWARSLEHNGPACSVRLVRGVHGARW
jgi:hypothetical protein